jgi:hypothetical protein
MLELILLVLFFLSSRFAEWVVLGVILVYGTWAIYMKTRQPDVWLKIQEADDGRRARVCGAIGSGVREICRRVAIWITPQSP